MTNKPSAPVVGFNHNVQYGERVYHVQTEDSGLPHAHYITHLFVGGNIIASMKSSYADNASDADLAKLVRRLMEEQHKRMLKRLIAGEFRDVAARFGAHHYEPGVLADGTNTASYVNTDAAKAAPPAPARAPVPAPAARPPAAAPAPRAPAAAPVVRPATAPPFSVTTPTRVPRISPPAPVPQRPHTVAPRTPGQPLPAVTRGPMMPAKPTAPPRMTPLATPPRVPPAVAAHPRPPVFSDGPVEMPTEDLPTLFAEELISEKSLDEVILAFLSADLDPPK